MSEDKLKDFPVVLVVDDNPEMNNFISGTLSDKYNVVSAYNGEEGLSKALSSKPDLILAEVMTPETSGDNILLKIRAKRELDSIPVIMLAAKSDDELKNKMFQDGAQDYLIRPFTGVELESKVSNLVKMKRAKDFLQHELNSQSEDILILIRELSDRKKSIEEILSEKEILLKEVHHRVKNNLQVISSLLSLQANYINDPDILNIFNDSRDRVRSMALIHEHIYKSQTLTLLNFAVYIKDLAAYLFNVYRSYSSAVVFINRSEEIFIDIQKGIPLGLIINELITNSLKYAFPGDFKSNRKEIYVELKKTGSDEKILIIRDNGAGFKKDVDFENSSSLGLQLVKTLVEQIDGRLEFRQNKGTEFIIKFT